LVNYRPTSVSPNYDRFAVLAALTIGCTMLCFGKNQSDKYPTRMAWDFLMKALIFRQNRFIASHFAWSGSVRVRIAWSVAWSVYRPSIVCRLSHFCTVLRSKPFEGLTCHFVDMVHLRDPLTRCIGRESMIRN